MRSPVVYAEPTIHTCWNGECVTVGRWVRTGYLAQEARHLTRLAKVYPDIREGALPTRGWEVNVTLRTGAWGTDTHLQDVAGVEGDLRPCCTAARHRGGRGGSRRWLRRRCRSSQGGGRGHRGSAACDAG